MNTPCRRPAHRLVKLLPALAIVGLVGCNGLPLGLVGPGAGAGIVSQDEARFKPAATAATFAPEFKGADQDGDQKWDEGELSRYLAANPLPEAFLMEIEGIKGYALSQADAKATSAPAAPALDARVKALIAKILKKFDVDGDGKLSAEEALALRNEAYRRRAAAAPPAGQPPKDPNQPGVTNQLPKVDGQMPMDPNGMTRPGMPALDCKAAFAQVDKNADGFVTWEEFYGSRPVPATGDAEVAAAKDKAMEAFKQADKDGDGKVSLDEHCAMGPGQPGLPPVMPQPADCVGLFVRADANQDGQISWEEYYTFRLAGKPAEDPAFKEQVNKQFQELDTSDNENLDKEEWAKHCAAMPQPPVGEPPAGGCLAPFDFNRDGKVSFEEFSKAYAVRSDVAPADYKLKFESLDTNKDGMLDEQELCRNQPMPQPQPPVANPAPCEDVFKRGDKNADRRLELGEFSAIRDAMMAPPPGAVAPAIARDWSMEFKNLDRNADGFVDPAEFCQAQPQPPVGSPTGPVPTPPVANQPAPNVNPCDEFKRRDANADGKVSLDEHLAVAAKNNVPADQAKRNFEGMDGNKDGFLSPAEVGCRQ